MVEDSLRVLTIASAAIIIYIGIASKETWGKQKKIPGASGETVVSVPGSHQRTASDKKLDESLGPRLGRSNLAL